MQQPSEATAHELIRLLLLEQRDETGLVERAEQFRSQGEWQEIERLWKAQEQSKESLVCDDEALLGIAEMYRGVVGWFHEKFDRKATAMHFRKAEEAFSCLGNRYAVGLVYMAQGFTRLKSEMDAEEQAQSKDAEEQARLWFCRSLQEFSWLATHCDRIGDRAGCRRSGALVGRIEELLKALEKKKLKREHVHLIPYVGEVAAGEPKLIAAAISVDVQKAESGDAEDEAVIVLAGRRYTLCDPKNRKQKIPLKFSSEHEYFTFDVKGDSMIGVGLKPRDRILAQRVDDVDSGEIAVVVVEGKAGPTGLVKIVAKRKDAILLKSANPAYKTREFSTRAVKSGALKIQGKACGILVEEPETE
ncbi:MAG TPA: S24 family peptidase [Anaerolineae bacterium]|nr:S24 family peptidase [Anaerolineae bacterium]